MRAAPCGGATTYRHTFISWAEWLCDSLLLHLHLCLSSSLSFSSCSFCFIPSFLCLSFLSLYPCVNEPQKLCILSSVSQWKKELKWKLIVRKSEIHSTDGRLFNFLFSFSLFYVPPPILFFFVSHRISLLWILSLSQSCGFVCPFFYSPSLLTWNIHFCPMKYGEGPHELFTG